MNKTDLIRFLDLTSLGDHDTPNDVDQLCRQAITPYGNVAAVCIWPQFVKQAKALTQGTGINIATVINFPHANDGEVLIDQAIQAALTDGADEIDAVLPYRHLLSGDIDYVTAILQQYRASCGDTCLKVIIESGELNSVEHIALATQLALDAGADFVKTSTGKTNVGATLDAVRIILETIKVNQSTAGLKISGGIRDLATAEKYVTLTQSMMGESWLTPTRFRIGTSSLLKAILS